MTKTPRGNELSGRQLNAAVIEMKKTAK